MARQGRSRRRLRRWQRDTAAVAFSLFPMLVMAGLFSPAVVHVQEDLVDDGPGRPRIVKLASDGARRPLLIPRDFSAGFIPELVDLERLFDTGGASPEARRLARLLAFSRHDGESIVLTDVSGSVPGFLFADVLQSVVRTPMLAAQQRPFDDPILASHGPGYVPFLNGGRSSLLRPRPPPPPVPEPGTAPLVGLGLASLAYRRRAQRDPDRSGASAAAGGPPPADDYFQPITS